MQRIALSCHLWVDCKILTFWNGLSCPSSYFLLKKSWKLNNMSWSGIYTHAWHRNEEFLWITKLPWLPVAGTRWEQSNSSCDRTCILCVLSLLFLSALLLSLHTGIESCKATKIAPKPTKNHLYKSDIKTCLMPSAPGCVKWSFLPPNPAASHCCSYKASRQLEARLPFLTNWCFFRSLTVPSILLK